MQLIRDAAFRQRLIADADVHGTKVDLDKLYVLPLDGPARYDCPADTSLAAIAEERGVSPAAAFIELLLETDGALNCNLPILNQDLGAVEEMLDDPLVTLGLADAGAHVGQIMDASQPTFLLTYWVQERQRWTLEEAVRRLTSDTADLFGIVDRGRLVRRRVRRRERHRPRRARRCTSPSSSTTCPAAPGGTSSGAGGYEYTLVNGEVFMDHGEHTGAFAGRLLRSGV